MTYQPPYTITSSIVSLVADISERMGYLSALESESRTLYLRRVNRIRTIQGSLAIEGKKLSPNVRPPQVERLLETLVGDMSRDQLQKAIGLQDRKSFRALYLAPALAAGLIEMSIPEKPNSRLQKYRLADLGRAWLSQSGEQ